MPMGVNQGSIDSVVQRHYIIVFGAEVVEWQTRTFEGRVGKPVRVQIPPSAPTFHPMSDWALKVNAVAAGVVGALGFTSAWKPSPGSRAGPPRRGFLPPLVWLGTAPQHPSACARLLAGAGG